jgi:diacylglycerol kinase (ATP)
MHIVFIIHGGKKKLRLLPQIIANLLPQNAECETHFTTNKGHGKMLAYAAAPAAQLVVAVGGDGTFNEVVNGIMKFSVENSTAVLPKIALLPQGSGNDFARNFNWPKTVDNFFTRLQQGNFMPLDVGMIEYANAPTEYFINVASAGIGPRVVGFVQQMPQKWSGKMKFGLASLLALVSNKISSMEITGQNFSHSGKTLAVAFANGKYFGSGIGIAPDALLFDGKLEVTIIGNLGLWQYLRYLPAMKRAEKIVHKEVHYYSAQSVEIHQCISIEKDGEMGLAEPIRIKCIASKLQLLT